MALTYPTQADISNTLVNALVESVNTGQADTAKHIDPTLDNSIVKGLVESTTAGISDNYNLVKALEIQLFPQTATGVFLDRWLATFGITKAPATKAEGSVVFTGTALTTIPATTNIQKLMALYLRL